MPSRSKASTASTAPPSPNSVPELTSPIPDIQFKVDRLDTGLDPLGLAGGAMPFDLTPINPGDGGKTHYEQIRERSFFSLTRTRRFDCQSPTAG